MTYQQIFNDVKKCFSKAKASHFNREFAFQFNITGEGEGIFYAAYKNGTFSVEPYDYKDRDVIFEADGDTLKNIASGKLEVCDAIKEGKLAIDGDHEAAKMLMFLVADKKTAKTETKATPTKKAESKPAKKETPAAKTNANPEVKAAAKPEAKTAAKPEAKPVVKTETKAAAKPEAKPVVKAEVKAAVKTEAKPEGKEASKPAVQTEKKPTGKAKK